MSHSTGRENRTRLILKNMRVDIYRYIDN
ncbi:hypothetical protein FWK35_00039383 [Aphis craccivora]|uniref:Uncharacterized protein n=1 Tax=Aphis craccivora TaxID=307492 RepID=A0A6G0YFL6_APHCR|nr:hypothetical protein FWK35_00039383 [Aphis craccivora]